MSMSRWSRDQRDKREREYQAWYATLTEAEQHAEDERQEIQLFKNFLIVILGICLFCGLAILSSYVKTP